MSKKVVKSNLADQVCISLRESIISGEFKSGTKLPSENDLAEEFGTSRLTIRLAIQKLNAMGLLETKVGEGSFVKKFNYENYINNISELIFNPDMMKDIKDFRLGIEIAFSLLAARNRTENEIIKLEKLCSEYEKLYFYSDKLNGNVLTSLALLDFDIHFTICKMSHNKLYEIIYLTVKNMMIEYMKTLITIRTSDYNNPIDRNKAPFKMHRNLLNAIKDKDEKNLKKIMIDMINYEVLIPEDSSYYYDNYNN